ncbi:MAG: AAA family ATPase [Phycisphaerae bacterium]|nr:AAA family ATPase [Saprospiraceae bacterium]
MLNEKRILILGSGGSGKTTFTRKLAAKTQLPVYHLDALHWKPNWTAPNKAAWQYQVADLVQENSWIIDGSYFGTLNLRLPRAELIVFLDMPNWRCIWNILKRRVQYAQFRGKIRPGMPPECPETLYFSFLKWVWQYPRHDKPKVFEAIEKWKIPEANVLVFKSYEAMEKFLNALPEPENAEIVDLSDG